MTSKLKILALSGLCLFVFWACASQQKGESSDTMATQAEAASAPVCSAAGKSACSCSSGSCDTDGDKKCDCSKAADCACEQGKAGEAVWCDKCNVGFVDGKKVACKACFEKKTKGSTTEPCGCSK